MTVRLRRKRKTVPTQEVVVADLKTVQGQVKHVLQRMQLYSEVLQCRADWLGIVANGDTEFDFLEWMRRMWQYLRHYRIAQEKGLLVSGDMPSQLWLAEILSKHGLGEFPQPKFDASNRIDYLRELIRRAGGKPPRGKVGVVRLEQILFEAIDDCTDVSVTNSLRCLKSEYLKLTCKDKEEEMSKRTNYFMRVWGLLRDNYGYSFPQYSKQDVIRLAAFEVLAMQDDGSLDMKGVFELLSSHVPSAAPVRSEGIVAEIATQTGEGDKSMDLWLLHVLLRELKDILAGDSRKAVWEYSDELIPRMEKLESDTAVLWSEALAAVVEQYLFFNSRDVAVVDLLQDLRYISESYGRWERFLPRPV